MIPFAVYCDGGTISRNPSKLGSTWAWCWVDDKGQRTKEDYGVIEPEDLGMDVCTNNTAELYAALRLIASLPKDWDGILYTDSLLTLRRITNGNKFKNVPLWMQKWCRCLRANHKYRVTLLAGHPTRNDLKRGFKERNGHPVSIHNAWADRKCTELSKDFQMRMGLFGG